MKANFNKWFHEYNRYVSKISTDKIDYNDTSFVNLTRRLKPLTDINSELLNEQPYGVIGNNRGLLHLMDLLSKSSYSFEDIDQSLVDTYKTSLQSAMSNMLVNTHAIMLRCTKSDKRYVSYDSLSRYYIIDAPFNQMHFGERDEFIRQRISNMHIKSKDNYIDLMSFVSNDIESLLGFSIMCTVNGYICNDCKIAIDDMGFKFKIAWLNPENDNPDGDIEFIIYKLDTVKTCNITFDASVFEESDNPIISYNDIDGLDGPIGNVINGNVKCIMNIYNPDDINGARVVPNFGLFTENGLKIEGLQNYTREYYTKHKLATAHVIVYALKYLNEVPNVFPAVNYYNILTNQKAYTEKEENVVDLNGTRIVVSSQYENDTFPICTPPIAIDRDALESFQIMKDCVNLRSRMKRTSLKNQIDKARTYLDTKKEDINRLFILYIVEPLESVVKELTECYHVYVNGGIITSLISSSNVILFKEMIDNFKEIIQITNPEEHYNELQEIRSRGYYDLNKYEELVDRLTEPFETNSFKIFKTISTIQTNFFFDKIPTKEEQSKFPICFEYTPPEHYKRPVSEQCFITLKYDNVKEAWLFALPDIEHFNGIGNTFYIKNNLKGDEIFKFFVLYTDTESPSETSVDKLPLETIYDFDKFYDEVSQHIGYIKYWNAENKLMKLSKILYNKYDDERVVQILSKILSGTISADDIIKVYETNLKYDEAGRTTLGWNNEIHKSIYTENSLAAPFAINYLFYTLNMMRDNEDKMEAYFMQKLLDKKHSKRYVDIDISDVINKDITFPINYSQYSLAPNIIDINSSTMPIGTNMYYEVPYVFKDKDISTSVPYRYTFNLYKEDIHYPVIGIEGLSNDNGYVNWSDIQRFNGKSIKFVNDIEVVTLITKYITYTYNAISEIETNYTKTFDVRYIIKQYKSNAGTIVSAFNNMIDNEVVFQNEETLRIIDKICNNDEIIEHFESIHELLDKLDIRERANGKRYSIKNTFSELTTFIRKVYTYSGFDKAFQPRMRKLYKHLKKFDTRLSIYELDKWWNDFDMYAIEHMEEVLSKNEAINDLYNGTVSIIQNYRKRIQDYKNMITSEDVISKLKEKLNEITIHNKWETYFKPLTEYCKSVYENNIFDMFAIDEVHLSNNDVTYVSKPYYITLKPNSETHTKSPIDESTNDYSLIFYVDAYQEYNDKWKIKSIVPICEYCFFSGEQLNGLVGTIYDKTNTKLGTIVVDISFIKAGSSAGNDIEIEIIPNISSTSIKFNNEHEEMNVVTRTSTNSMIENRKVHDMHFELLFGNKYIPLEHDCEYILDPITYEEHSVDIIRIPNKIINSLMTEENSEATNAKMYFEPVQVFHLPTDVEECITSVYGKCFVGQTVYLVSDDGLSVFPTIITAIDHSDAHGFVEARIDKNNTKWFGTSDIEVISKYLFEDIKCHVIPDNMMNFVKEYSNPSYLTYNIPDLSFEETSTPASLPGDPIFVTSNEQYVHTRLNYMFHEDIDNRFIDDDKKSWKYIYLGEVTPSIESDKPIVVNLINRETHDITLPELYPILRDEPDDHDIWEKELETFEYTIEYILNPQKIAMEHQKLSYENSLQYAETDSDKAILLRAIDNANRKIRDINNRIKQIKHYAEQLESPTTWYNVRSYDAAMIYIDNGRSLLSPSVIVDKRDIPIAEKISVFLYDWENKQWINPSEYTIETKRETISTDNKSEYYTKDVMTKMIITPTTSFNSGSIFVYVAYNKSDVFDSIPMNDNQCYVKFKPILSIARTDNGIPYSKINVRKHFDGYEEYVFKKFNLEDKGFDKLGLYIDRVDTNGNYLDTPILRIKDIQLTQVSDDLPITGYSIYKRIPFKNIGSEMKGYEQEYSSEVKLNIDNFTSNEQVKLVCIENNNGSFYDGTISNVMFNGETSIGSNGKQIITITDSSLDSFVSGQYYCTVFRSNDYKSYGGIVLVTIHTNDTYNTNKSNEWIRIPVNTRTRLMPLPKEFVIVPDNQSIDIANCNGIKVTLKSSYDLMNPSSNMITELNTGDSSHRFFYNDKIHLRYPLSDIQKRNPNKRLIVDTTKNENIKVGHMTYIGIPRFSSTTIPIDGVFDVTGYIPTPLSRDRYEWWVNGRQIQNDDVLILSPTSFQLKNLRSLKNFELVELVDDVNKSEIMKVGNTYTDIYGETYGSYQLALLSGKTMVNQDIKFVFNASNHKSIHDYTRSMSYFPNNIDIEKDIFETLTTDTDSIKYNELINLPKINGVTVYNMKSCDFGIMEISIEELAMMLDYVWKTEEVTNPLFITSHKSSMNNNTSIKLHKKSSSSIGISDNDTFVIYATGLSDRYFTMYITSNINRKIHDAAATKKIIPFVKVGTYIVLDKSYQDYWLCCTEPDVKPIKL